MIKVKETKEILNRISYLFSSGSIPTCYSCCLVFLFSRSCAVFFIFFRRRNFFHAVSFHCNFWRTFSYFFYRWNSISGFFKSIVFPFLVSLQRFFVSAIPPFPIYSIFWLNFIFFSSFYIKISLSPPLFFSFRWNSPVFLHRWNSFSKSFLPVLSRKFKFPSKLFPMLSHRVDIHHWNFPLPRNKFVLILFFRLNDKYEFLN